MYVNTRLVFSDKSNLVPLLKITWFIMMLLPLRTTNLLKFPVSFSSKKGFSMYWGKDFMGIYFICLEHGLI